MAIDRRRWLPLLLDAALAAPLLLLDVRDLWFKLRWLGPHDTFAFSTSETRHFPLSTAAQLQPTTQFSYVDQKSQRVSGWSSFLQQCESLTAFPEGDETRGFQYAMGKNCMIGSSVRAQELVLTGSIRVDSIAWTACELLYKNRKPPICHSPIVTQFRERFNIQNEVVNRVESTMAIPGLQESYAAKPGSEAEAELVDLLEVISTSSPISAATCVEGFIVKGPRRYTATVFGCGSNSFYRSVLVETDIPTFSRFQRDKAWLTTDFLSVGGMSFLVRENRRSVYTVHDSTHGRRVLEHKSLLNFSTSGSLYTTMILVDLALLMLSMCSIVEITRFMLWPLWKPLIASEYQTSSTRATKMGFVPEDYAQVLQVSLQRSPPVALLTVLSRLLSWVLVLPSIVVWSDGNFDTGDIHAFLTLIRMSDLVALAINFLWDIVVFCDEKYALMVVRKTYVSLLEVRCVGAAVIVVALLLFGPQTLRGSYGYDRQRIIDRSSFENVTAVANTLSSDLDVSKNPQPTLFGVYYPLMILGAVIVFIVGLLVVFRLSTGKDEPSRSLLQSVGGSTPVVQPSTTKDSPIRKLRKDMRSKSVGILMRPMSPPPSPTRETPCGSIAETPCDSIAEPPELRTEINDGRLPFEKLLDVPIRARSLVRSSWALEKMSGGQLHLIPSSYLEYGVVLIDRFMKTRCGFMDVVQPVVHVQAHQRRSEQEDEPHTVAKKNLRPNLR